MLNKLYYPNKLTFVLLVILLFYSNNLLYPVDSSKVNVYIVDVGNGDAIFINIFKKYNILIDSGPISKYNYFSFKKKQGIHYFLNKHKIKNIDLYIITHPHSDHIGGLIPILKKLKIKKIIDPGYAYPSKVYYNTLKMIEEKQIKYRVARRGMIFNFDNVSFEVLSPHKIIRNAYSSANANSIVVKMIYKDISFLFTGDIEKETEYLLTLLKDKLSSTFIKAPHQGSDTSNTMDFLKLVSPKVVFISCEANKINNPSPLVLGRYKTLKSIVYRTDIHGTINLKTNGKSYSIKTEKKEK